MDKTVALVMGIFLIVVIISFFISVYNKLVMLKFNIEKAFANIDIILKQRADEIPNIVKVINQSTSYESGVLEKLTLLRTDFLNSSNIEDKTTISNEMSKTLKSVFSISENYPTLLSNNSFLELQKRVSGSEDKIADRREFFNDSVNLYNIGIYEFPNIIFAKLLNYTQRTLLTISESEKKYDGVSF